MQAAGLTDRGCVRETNEDSILLDRSLYAVADGLGGHLAGEVASRKALQCIKEFLAEVSITEKNAIEFLSQAIDAANREVFSLSAEKTEYNGMGTTIVLVKAVRGVLFYAYVGDSRLYLFRGDALSQITRDHSLVAQMLVDGCITPDQAAVHPSKNIITRAVGTAATVQADTGRIELLKGDILLLCSDGLTNMLSDEEMQDKIAKHKQSIGKLAEELLVAAKQAGGDDNISIICLKY